MGIPVQSVSGMITSSIATSLPPVEVVRLASNITCNNTQQLCVKLTGLFSLCSILRKQSYGHHVTLHAKARYGHGKLQVGSIVNECN